AFVPQELLSETVLNIAHILPSYWFVKNNNAIVLLSDFKGSSLQPIVISMMIMMGFVILFFGLANIISKQKLKKQAFL
ncbi:MAG: ABC transporter permease, partial [Bacilli bacterium]|nr:ABC transporter permease [Bacilli bacterium]